MKFWPALVTLAVLAGILVSQPAPKLQVGPLPDGSFLLNSGWRIKPAGRQVPLDTLPMATALSPDRRHLLVLNGGLKPPSISVLDAASGAIVSSAPVADGWLGLVFSPKGDRVYVGGGSEAAVFEFGFTAGRLTPVRTIPIVEKEKRTPRDFIGDVQLTLDGRFLFAADLFHDAIAVINLSSGTVIEHFPTGRRPYRILFHPDGKSFFVSSWADGSVYHQETDSGLIREKIRLGAQTTDMIWRAGKAAEAEQGEFPWVARLFVTASNTNQVYVVGVAESKATRHLETINLALTPRQPAGMTPSALGLSSDGNRLFVACSDANAVAVVNTSESKSNVEGYIPTGWYPTAVRSLADGRLVILNGKGWRSYPNPQGPNPTRITAPAHLEESGVEYAPRLQRGSASFVDPFDPDQLDRYSRQVMENSPYRDALLDRAGGPPDNPIPDHPGGATPIQHVIYVVKENRTYDQVLGDMKEGNGDPSLVLFGEQISPNHHKLAREFVLLDNFYVNSDVSADGHNWSAAAIAPAYVQRMWPNSYGKRRNLYDYEGQEPAALPPAGYLWTNAMAAGISLRNFGWWCTNLPQPSADGTQIKEVRDHSLARFTNLRYRGFDLNYPDTERIKVFLQDLAEFEKSGDMPRLVLVRLGNDHTSGAAPGKIRPLSQVADNDYALGQLVEAVSKSKFWPTTAIFVLEDDAQNGPDHVDSHRSIAYVISPYVKRRSVDSTMYNTTSMLRTMELILGLRPMTTFDAGARPMYSIFRVTPDLAPYTAEKNRRPLDERNPGNTPVARRSRDLDLSEADQIDDDEMNDILWAAIRGTSAPPPVRSYFSR